MVLRIEIYDNNEPISSFAVVPEIAEDFRSGRHIFIELGGYDLKYAGIPVVSVKSLNSMGEE